MKTGILYVFMFQYIFQVFLLAVNWENFKITITWHKHFVSFINLLNGKFIEQNFQFVKEEEGVVENETLEKGQKTQSHDGKITFNLLLNTKDQVFPLSLSLSLYAVFIMLQHKICHFAHIFIWCTIMLQLCFSTFPTPCNDQRIIIYMLPKLQSI